MVKADYTRDYYADLDLPQTADVNEVKKQFRKLGMSSLAHTRALPALPSFANRRLTSAQISS